jgi:hypothetical protein
MPYTDYNTPETVPPTIHVDMVATKPPYVQALTGHPGTYALYMGDLRAYFTAEQWDALDTAVRAHMPQVNSNFSGTPNSSTGQVML